MVVYSIEEDIHIDTLADHLKSKKKICFWLGAGFSKIAGYPLWDELIVELINFISKKQSIEPNMLRLLNDNKTTFPRKMQCLKSLNKDLYEKGIKEIFGNVDQAFDKNEEIFKIIGEFLTHKILVITTNIDKSLQCALNLSDDQISIIPIKHQPPNPKIIYLHGRIDIPKSWILCEEDYANFYYNSPRIVGEYWEQIFKEYEVFVYIGYSLSEMEVYSKFFSRTARKKKFYWIPGVSESNKDDVKNTIRYFKDTLKLEFRTIPYKIEDKKLVNLLKLIHNRAFSSTL